MGLAIELSEFYAGLRSRRAACGIHPNTLHPGKINEQAAIGHTFAGNVVTSAPNGDRQVVLACKFHGVHHVARAVASCDQVGMLVDHAVPEFASLIVTGIFRT